MNRPLLSLILTKSCKTLIRDGEAAVGLSSGATDGRSLPERMLVPVVVNCDVGWH